jgi:surfactin synthase thioesterase subunit
LTDSALIEYVINNGGIRPGVDPSWLQLMLPAIKADYEIFENYDDAEQPYPNIKLQCSMTLIAGHDDVAAPIARMCPWEDYCNVEPAGVAKFEILSFPGSHFFLLDAEPSHQVARRIYAACMCAYAMRS